MGNIMDYVEWRGDLSFEQDPFNLVDNLILSEIIYIRWDRYLPKRGEAKTLREIATAYFKRNKAEDVRVGLFFDKQMALFAQKVAMSERFGSIKVHRHVNTVEKDKQRQFSAITYELSPDRYYIAFKGTDDSLIGWWEDLNTLACYPVVAQRKAEAYAKTEFKAHPNATFYLGGHSKGGNLAVYAACRLPKEAFSRVERVFSNDGQGFTPGVFPIEKYGRVYEKVTKIVPEDCMVGNLLALFPCEQVVIKPLCSGVLEHDGLQWSVKGNSFETVPDISQKSKATRDAVAKVVSELTQEDREQLVNEVYDFVLSLNAETLTDLKKEHFLVPRLARALSPKCSKIFMNLVHIFVSNNMVI